MSRQFRMAAGWLQSRAVRPLFAFAAVLGTAFLAQPALAGGGDDHSHEGPAPTVSAPDSRRMSTSSDLYEVVGVLKSGRLTLYLDRYDTNEPVTDAKVSLTLAGRDLEARPAPDETYAAAIPEDAVAGALEVVINVSSPSGDDLLIGSIPAGAAAAEKPHHAEDHEDDHATTASAYSVARVKAFLNTPNAAGGWSLAIFGAGLGLGLVLRAIRSGAAAVALGVLFLAAMTGFAYAGGGDDHTHDAPVAVPGADTPQRLAGGQVFVPKPSQRILELRTVVARPSEAEGAVRLVGRIIPDPNRGGLVQSIGGGRVIAPVGGMARLGQAVRKGETLARIERPIIQGDQAMVAERQGEIGQLIGLAETKLIRAKRLAESGAGTKVAVADIEIELEGLRGRRSSMRDIQATPEELVAPVDGVVASSSAVAGQVVQPQDVLFQIIDPKSLWVEAISHDDDAPAGEAAMLSAEGASLRLASRGVSRALHQQAVILHFEILDPPGSLRVGQPVTVLAASGVRASGVVLPRGAVSRGANGEQIVWRHGQPELFEPLHVRVEPLDAARVVVRAGVDDGDRVVVRGADLINQIR